MTTAERKREHRAAPNAALNRAAQARWYAAHREEAIALTRAYRAAKSDEVRARDRVTRAKWRAANRGKITAHTLMCLYGLTQAERDEMLDLQGGLCACCGRPAREVDHCHECEGIKRRGSVRGILCHRCNLSLDTLAKTSPVHAAYKARHDAVCPARTAEVAA